jgi:CubicO group peptidase (beta-lactamase class C family)
MRLRSFKWVVAGLLGLAAAVPALTQQAPLAPAPTVPPKQLVTPAPANGVAANLTKTDVDAWLDGFMPYAIARGGVPGAVVVVVKDGQVVTERGFGYADVASHKPVDPARTLFRPGSTSKLYTWTAVMQLVEAGKLNLDADVNQYLDFKVPAWHGQPITLRQIMTHSAGFEEIIKGLLSFSHATPLGEELKKRIPERIFAPGSTPAYSNYATAMAGYIVERVSGIPFDTYIERNIFDRLGMRYASFRQPLPANLKPFMATGYEDGKPQRFEYISLAPAGSSSIAGGEMAKFMIAHLNDGGPLLKPATARLMHTPNGNIVPGVNRMALGFYEQHINGRTAIAHGGDTDYFHSDLWLFPAEKIGMFVSLNARGKDNAAGAIRGALFDEFADRYLPDPAGKQPLVELPTAKEHAKLLVGNWTNSRRVASSFVAFGNLLGGADVGLDDNGRPLVAFWPDRSGAPRTWIETAPFVWQDAAGHQRLGAKVENGKVVRWSVDDISPFMVFDRTPWYLDGSWLLPVLLASLALVAVAALGWPILALTRRRYGSTLALVGEERRTYRTVRGFAWGVLLVSAGWFYLISGIENFDSHGKTDWLIILLQIAGTLAYFGLLGLSVWNLVLAFRGKRSWWSKLWSALLVLAAFFILWVALAFKLISFGTGY